MPEEQGPGTSNEPVPPAEQGPGNSTPPGAGDRRESSAADDLADGLDLMLRAARKAVRSLDPRIEQAGKRALEQLEHFDAAALGEVGRRVAGKVDPKKLEQVAEEAGREIAGLVEKLASRIEGAIGRHAGGAEDESDEQPDTEPDAPARKVRINPQQ